MTDPTRTGPADGAPRIDVVGLMDVDRVVADLVTMVGIPSVNPFAGPASPTAREHELAPSRRWCFAGEDDVAGIALGARMAMAAGLRGMPFDFLRALGFETGAAQ